ncbi:MAG TPA: hypothetical protein VL093_10755 [Flavipsychrobacter sp.]|nr:hypothetical protein [Flavipsychrobacter sp.]
MKTATALLILLPLLMSVSCDRPECLNDNPVFDQNPPGSTEYNRELVKQMQLTGTKDIRYRYDSSLVRNGHEYMVIHVQGKNLCAVAEVVVEDKDVRRGLRNGVGYRGAELKDVHIAAREDSGKEILVLKSIGRILD